MTSVPPDDAAEPNPFSSRSVRPGAMPFLFSDGTTARELVRRLNDLRERAQIVGPHGSGKTTLLEALRQELSDAGREVFWVSLHDGQRRLPAEFRARLRGATVAGSGAAQPIVIVDGYEQLNYWSRMRILCRCILRGWGLLVTAHENVGFPTLWQTSVTPEVAAAIVGQLSQGKQPPPSTEELAAALSRHDGNLRDVLFELYDAYERRRR